MPAPCRARSSSPICPAPATTSTMPTIDMPRALQRSPSNRSPNQSDRGERHEGRIEIEDQQRQRDADPREGDEHAQVEDRIGDGGAGHRPAVARRQRSQLDDRDAVAQRPPGAERQRHAQRAHARAPGDQRQAGDARPVGELGQRPERGEEGRGGQHQAGANQVAPGGGAADGLAIAAPAAHRGDSASALSASAVSSSPDRRSQSAARRSTASRAALCRSISCLTASPSA